MARSEGNGMRASGLQRRTIMAVGQSRVARLARPVSERDHVLGPANAPATLVEYGDYECPYCGFAHPMVQSVLDRLQGHVRFAFRHFPLAEIHPHAVLAAEAAEAAGAQDKFWPMHDMLYENLRALRELDLLRTAAALGLHLPGFTAELADHRWEPPVREDFMSGVRSGVNGTPTFFVNGIRHDGSWDADSLTEALIAAAGLRAA
jgi:protein-disulfide isomerase